MKANPDFSSVKMFRLMSHQVLIRSELVLPACCSCWSLLAELLKIKHSSENQAFTLASQQHTGSHYLEQVASTGRSATLRMKAVALGGPRRLPVSCQKVNLSVFHCSCPDNLGPISFSLPCLTPFPLISYVYQNKAQAVWFCGVPWLPPTTLRQFLSNGKSSNHLLAPLLVAPGTQIWMRSLRWINILYTSCNLHK